MQKCSCARVDDMTDDEQRHPPPRPQLFIFPFLLKRVIADSTLFSAGSSNDWACRQAACGLFGGFQLLHANWSTYWQTARSFHSQITLNPPTNSTLDLRGFSFAPKGLASRL